MEKIALLGMMASGKTTLGQALAGKLSIPFVDADREIEHAAGMTIPEIFERHGEPGFRQRERDAVRDLTARPGPLVMALGGGAFIQDDVRDILSGTALTIYLKVTPEELVRRLEATDIAHRPMLASADWRKRTTDIAAERNAVYMNADVIFPADDTAIEVLTERLADVVRHLCGYGTAHNTLETAHA